MKKPLFCGEGYQIEKRAIGNEDVATAFTAAGYAQLEPNLSPAGIL